MSLKFRGGLVSATLTLAAIAIVGCGGGSTETAEETPAADGETTEETTTADSGSEAPAEGVLGECELVQDVLDEDFNNGFGASLSGDSGEIKADDDVISASVAASSAADGMEDAQDEAQEVLDGLTANRGQ